MAGARPFIMSLMIVTLGAFLMIAFVFNFLKVNNPTSDVFDDQYKLNSSATKMQNSLQGFNDITNTVKEKFSKSKPEPQDYVFLIFYGAFEIPWTLFSFISSGIVSLATVLFNLLGGTIGSQVPGFENSEIMSILLGIIIAGIILTGIFLLIKAIRGGESER